MNNVVFDKGFMSRTASGTGIFTCLASKHDWYAYALACMLVIMVVTGPVSQRRCKGITLRIGTTIQYEYNSGTTILREWAE